MAKVVFEKLIALDLLPREWELVKVAVDWSGLPLLLMAEGGLPYPTAPSDPEAVSRWYQTPPDALHIVFLKGHSVRSTRIVEGVGRLSMHVQPYGDGWIVAHGRGGQANTYSAGGAPLDTLNLGDAIADLQTLPDGRIWVSYFDEGVYGTGISTEGLVCFDRSGKPIFRFREHAQKSKLPHIDDCYALNVAMNGDVWVNYYSDFPLLLLRDMELSLHLPEFGSLGRAFAVHENSLIYLRNSKLFSTSLDRAKEQETVDCVDSRGNPLCPTPIRRLAGAARDVNVVLNTGAVIHAASI